MADLGLYNIDIKSSSSEVQYLKQKYSLNDSSLRKLGIFEPEITRGDIIIGLTIIKRQVNLFVLAFDIKGYVLIPCTRCLDSMKQEIEQQHKIRVEIGTEYKNEGETIILSEQNQTIDLTSIFREFIILGIPLRHIHEEKECNQEFLKRLDKHTKTNSTEKRLKEIDPRWEKLKNIFEND